MTVIVAAESLKQIHHQPSTLRRAVGKLMSIPMVFTCRYENILVKVERSDKPLYENVDKIIVTVGAVMKINTEGTLPLLSLENMASVRRMEQETFKVEVAHTANFRAWLEVHIDIVANTIRAAEKSDFRVEIRTDSSVLGEYFEPVRLVIEPHSQIGLT